MHNLLWLIIEDKCVYSLSWSISKDKSVNVKAMNKYLLKYVQSINIIL